MATTISSNEASVLFVDEAELLLLERAFEKRKAERITAMVVEKPFRSNPNSVIFRNPSRVDPCVNNSDNAQMKI